MSNTSTIHIKTDFDCKVYDYGQELGTTKADTYFNIELRKGEHELTFVFTGDDSIFKTIYYIVKDTDCDYRLIVEIAETIYNNAEMFYHSKDYSSAYSLYSTAAELGYVPAEFMLGYCYEYGLGVETNVVKAVEWYNKAAKKGYAKAQYFLGYSYYYGKAYGKGVERDPVKAVEWYTKAAEQGFTEAQYQLASCYESGVGTKEDQDKALELYTIAAESGYAEAQCALGVYYQFGGFLGRFYNEEDPVKAVKWYTKAAEQGYAQAQYNLGHCYECGVGVEKNLSEAAIWYKKAAEQEHEVAQLHLGICYENGIGVEKNLSKAVEWYTKAAKNEKISTNAKEASNRLKSIESEPIHYLFFDTETAGLPKDYNALTHWLKNWPRLVQLSWITTDEDCNVLSENDYIIYPDGFTIPEDAVRLHGITTEIAKEKGKPIKEVIDKFMEDFNAATTIVGHNIDFDKKIIGAELIRLGLNDIMSSKEALCTMKGSVDYCKIPSTHGYKWPKLQELHKKLFGFEFEDAHNSLSDVKATLKCFKEMKEKGLYAGKYLVKNKRNFSEEEIACVERNEIVAVQNGKTVCFYMNGGGQTFIPLMSTSSMGAGESIDLTKAKLITLGQFGKDDILRVIE